MHRNITSLAILLLSVLSFAACGAELGAERDMILEMDSRNKSVDFSLRADGEHLSYCVKSMSGDASAMDVFRVFLHAAHTLQDRQFEKVNLCFRGEERFVLDGVDFAVIGKEYESQNPMYTIRTFPEKLLLPDGTKAYKTHRGGVLYLMKVQMSDFNDMSEKWFLHELAAEIKAETEARRPKEFAADDEVF